MEQFHVNILMRSAAISRNEKNRLRASMARRQSDAQREGTLITEKTQFVHSDQRPTEGKLNIRKSVGFNQDFIVSNYQTQDFQVKFDQNDDSNASFAD